MAHLAEHENIRCSQSSIVVRLLVARGAARFTRLWELWGVIVEADVRRLALALPGAYEQASFGGRPSWRTAPRMFAWLRDDPEALVVWVDAVEDKDGLIAADSFKFFTTPHYDGQPIVLVRLEAINADEAAELIVDSWMLRAPRSLARTTDYRRRWVSTVTPPVAATPLDASRSDRAGRGSG